LIRIKKFNPVNKIANIDVAKVRGGLKMNVSEAIRLKRAIRQFTNQPLSDASTHLILNAGRRAQSSKNIQPWNFIAITDKSTLKALSDCGVNASHLAGAALGVAIIHPHPGEKFQLLFDIGQAAAYMQLAALELGIGSCLASIYETGMARRLLGFPEDMYLHIAISFGYPQDSDLFLRNPKKGGRRSLDEIIHWNNW
jgi:nitroreductase